MPRARDPGVAVEDGVGGSVEGSKGDLQNEFFNASRKDRTLMAVFLTNGKKLVGRIKSFDKFTLILDGQQGSQIVYKHAISTVGAYSPPANPRPPRGPLPSDGGAGPPQRSDSGD